MPKLRSPDCDCPNRGSIDITVNGGAAGHDQTYNIRPDGSATLKSCSLSFSCDAFTRKDNFGVNLIGAISGGIYSTGCIGGTDSHSTTIAAGAVQIRIIVEPECDPAQTEPVTSWTFTLVVTEDRC